MNNTQPPTPAQSLLLDIANRHPMGVMVLYDPVTLHVEIFPGNLDIAGVLYVLGRAVAIMQESLPPKEETTEDIIERRVRERLEALDAQGLTPGPLDS